MTVRAPLLCAAAACAYAWLPSAHARAQADAGRRAHTHLSEAPRDAALRPLDEAAVIALAHSADPEVLRAEAARAAAVAMRNGVGMHPNPSLQWGRQQMPGDGGYSQDVVSLQVPVVLSGRLNATRSGARGRGALADAEAALTRSAATLDALRDFYGVLEAQRRAALLATAVEALEQATRVLAHRLAQGTASGYEQSRIALELHLQRSTLRQARIESALRRGQLATRLGLSDPAPRLYGELAPGPSDLDALPEARGDAPSRMALSRARSDAREAQDAAADGWLPQLQLQAGVISERHETRSAGYVAGLTVGLPLWTRSQNARATADALALTAGARERTLIRTRQAQVVVARQRLQALMNELSQLDAETNDEVARVMRATASGYREGQLDVVALLDAQRAQTRVAMLRLSLVAAARDAELSLRAARGDFE